MAVQVYFDLFREDDGLDASSFTDSARFQDRLYEIIGENSDVRTLLKRAREELRAYTRMRQLTLFSDNQHKIDAVLIALIVSMINAYLTHQMLEMHD
jgi:hypothetical protein